MAKPVGPEERQTIIDLLQEHGGNRSKVAGMVGRSKQTVMNIAKAEGIESDVTYTKRATEARQAFREIDALEVLNAGKEVAQKYLEELKGFAVTKENAEALQKIMTSMGIAIDKQLLMQGKPTNINESRKGSEIASLFDTIKSRAEE